MAKTAPVALAMAILGAIVLVAVLAISTKQINNLASIGNIGSGQLLLLPSHKYLKEVFEEL